MQAHAKLLAATAFLAAALNSAAQPVILTQPDHTNVYVGETASFSVEAGGDFPYFQWRFNGLDLGGPQFDSTLTLMNVQFANAGPYSVVITDFDGSVTSQVAWLSVLPEDVVNLGEREWRFGQPTNPPVWDTTLNEDTYCTISSDGLTLFLQSRRAGGLGGFDLWKCTRPAASAAWSAPVNLGSPINSSADEFEPQFSPDGLSLYFASTRPGGSGADDLWVATRQTVAQSFGAPVNLGPAINSSSEDFSATVSADGLTLIFTSDRPGGLGGVYDFWISTRTNATAPWEPARLLGAPISSPAFDATCYLSPDGLVLFFGSNRSPGVRVNTWMARRPDTQSPFGEPALIKSIVDPTGQRSREPVSLSPDGATLYYIYFRDPLPNRGRGVLEQVSVTALPQLRAPGLNGGAEFQFDLLGREGANYEIQVSTDLSTWTPWLTTNTVNTLLLADPAPTSGSRRFYRALSH